MGINDNNKLAFAVRMASSYNEMVQAVIGEVPTGQSSDKVYSFPWTPFEKGFGRMYDRTTVRVMQYYSGSKITISQEVDRNNDSLIFCNSGTLEGYLKGDNNENPNKPKVKIQQISPETRDNVELDFMLREKSQIEDGVAAIPTFCVERELKFEEDGCPYKFQTVMTLQKYPDGSSKIDDDVLIKSISVSGKDISVGRDDLPKLAEMLTRELDILVTKGYGLFNDNIESVDDNGNITYTEDFIESGKKLKR
jgi:hypothetical protein